MTTSDVRCGVVIFSAREERIRTCGAKATHNLTFRGDTLFGICSRHNHRLDRAIPDLAARPREATA